MQDFAELHLKPETLAQYGLLDIPYPVPATDLKSALLDNGDLPLAMMLHGLQQWSRDGDTAWQQVEPAMDRLAELLTPEDARDVISAAGDHWWLEVGPVELVGKLVTIQRGDALIAAITARDDGRLRVAVFRPLDAKSAEYLIGLGQVPHPEHGVCMRDNNWSTRSTAPPAMATTTPPTGARPTCPTGRKAWGSVGTAPRCTSGASSRTSSPGPPPA